MLHPFDKYCVLPMHQMLSWLLYSPVVNGTEETNVNSKVINGHFKAARWRDTNISHFFL